MTPNPIALLKEKVKELQITPLMQKPLKAQELAALTVTILADFEKRLSAVEVARGL